MYAVYVVASADVGADVAQIVSCRVKLWSHERFVSHTHDEVLVFLLHIARAGAFPLPDGQCHYPCVQLHASLVAFVNGKEQRVVVRRLPRLSGQADVPWLKGRRVYHCPADAHLEEDGVDVCRLQAVEQGAELIALPLGRRGTEGMSAWPVYATDGGEPDGARLILGRLGVRKIEWGGGCVARCWRREEKQGCKQEHQGSQPGRILDECAHFRGFTCKVIIIFLIFKYYFYFCHSTCKEFDV